MKKLSLIILSFILFQAVYGQTPPPAFVTVWETTALKPTVTIPTVGNPAFNMGGGAPNYFVQIDWGDGTEEVRGGYDPDFSHDYAIAGLHEIRITGIFPQFSLAGSDPSNAELLREVKEWGPIEWLSMSQMFSNAANMPVTHNILFTATDTPDLSKVTSMSSMFSNNQTFNGDLSGWNVSNVTDMSFMFSSAGAFQGTGLDTWNVSNVMNMQSMFFKTPLFNADISDWNVSNVTNMSSMFSSAFSFNTDISDWNVSNVTNMTRMFSRAEDFEGDVSLWNVSNVRDMSYMFFSAIRFNANLNKWKVDSVRNMRNMFEQAVEFNSDLNDWNVSNVKDMRGMFWVAANFNGDLSDWNVSNVTNMHSMFAETDFFSGDLSDWNVSKVTNMRDMFLNAIAFNGDLSRWDVSNGQDFIGFLNFSGMSTYNYDQLLIGWDGLDLQDSLTFGAAGVNYRAGLPETSRSAIIADDGWTFVDGGLVSNSPPILNAPISQLLLSTGENMIFPNLFSDLDGDPLLLSVIPPNSDFYESTVLNDTVIITAKQEIGVYSPIMIRATDNMGGTAETNAFRLIVVSPNAFVARWIVDSTDLSITIPARDNPVSGYNYTVYWGDSTNNNVTADIGASASITHTYSQAGGYTVQIIGDFPHFDLSFSPSENRNKLLYILQWGNIAWETTDNMFFGAENMSIFARDVPNLSRVTSMENMFFTNVSLELSNFSGWDVSNVTNMGSMFHNTFNFRGHGLETWDVSNVQSMAGMFFQAFKFNGHVSNWNVSKVRYMQNMFNINNAAVPSAFNRNLSSWNVSKVENMTRMFKAASSFTSDLNSWDVSNVQYMDEMFSNARAFNSDLSRWNVSNVRDMREMFFNAHTFNNDLNDWDVSNVGNMSSMFNGARSFNGNLSEWNTHKVEDMNSMFLGATAFNQNMGDWNVSAVTNMNSMFNGATSFNRSIADWNVSAVTNMNSMFSDAAAFNQNMGSWDVSNVVNNFTDFLSGSGVSIGNYSSLLIGWERLDLQDGLTFDAVTRDGGNNITGINYDINAATTARQSIIDDDNWTFNDGSSLPNAIPVSNGAIEDFILLPGRIKTYTNVFTDPEGDPFTLTYSIDSGSIDLVDITIRDDTFFVKAGLTGGSVVISFRASTLSGAIQRIHATESFTLTVEDPALFITTWNVPGSAHSVTIPGSAINGFGYDYTIDWGDGTTTDVVSDKGRLGSQLHTYSKGGIYTVKVKGDFPYFRMGSVFHTLTKLVSIEQWGDIVWENGRNAFNHDAARDMVLNATDMPIFSPRMTDMNSMFVGARSFNGDLSGWDVSNISNMENLFSGAASFDGDMSDWNVSNVNNMINMFVGASSFTGKGLSAWNVSSVRDMTSMLKGTSFDQDLSTWNVSLVVRMVSMFENSPVFRGTGLEDWNVANVEAMDNMFSSASSFNENLNRWDVSKITNMENVFRDAASFNHDLNTWDVSHVTNMMGMFQGATLFNQDLSAWNVSNVRDMQEMFLGASSFNRNLGNWNVSGTENMRRMFYNASRFRGDGLNNWNVSSVTNMGEAFNLSSLSVYNYEEALIEWGHAKYSLSNQKDVPLGAVIKDFRGNKIGVNYRPRAASSRQSLIDNLGWIIDDGNLIPNVPFLSGGSVIISLEQHTPVTLPINTLFKSGRGDPLNITINEITGDGKITIEDNAFIVEVTGPQESRISLDAIDSYGNSASGVLFLRPLPRSEFISTWRSEADGTISLGRINSANESLDISIDWGDGSILQSLVTDEEVTLSHNYATAGGHRVSISGNFLEINLGSTTPENAARLLTIEQWSDIPWLNMDSAFLGAINMQNNANAPPNLSRVTSMQAMFQGTHLFNADLSNWNVSNVRDMSNAFRDAFIFNGELNNWNVSNVRDMSGMFRDARAFNKDLNNWSTSNVVDMSNMFRASRRFNGSVNNWNLSSVVNMSGIFRDARAFNRELSNWGLSKVEDMSDMFNGAREFNQGIGSWSVSSAKNMSNMFREARSFDQNLGNWNVSNVTNFTGFLNEASSLSNYNYEEILINWSKLPPQPNNTLDALVTDIRGDTIGIKYRARAYAERSDLQNDYSWTINDGGLILGNNSPTVINPPDNLFLEKGFSTVLVDLAPVFTDLDGDPLFFSAVSDDESIVTTSVSGDILTLTEGIDAGTAVITVTATDRIGTVSVSFSLVNDRVAFITTWEVPVTDLKLIIHTNGGPDLSDYDFTIDWGDGTSLERIIGDNPNPEHIYADSGTYTVAIEGIFLSFRGGGTGLFPPTFDNIKKLRSIDQWGNIRWESMASAFSLANYSNASSFEIKATDAPDLSNVTSISKMFSGVTFSHEPNLSHWNVSNVTDMSSMFSSGDFNGDLSAWNVSNVTDMNSMFSGSDFKGDLSAWNVSSVTDMHNMFYFCRSFNGDLSSWNVSEVTDMSEMFFLNTIFNSDLSAWNVSKVTDMSEMFTSNNFFNADLSSWNVSNVTDMNQMFYSANSFNGDLSAWNISKVTDFTNFLSQSGMSTYNYDRLLIGWATLDNTYDLEDDVQFGAEGIRYRTGPPENSRTAIIASDTWTFNDGPPLGNSFPTLVRPLPDRIFQQGFGSYTIALQDFFH